MPFHRDAFLRGLRDIAPTMLGIAPFGLITGVSAASIGLTPLEASAMSILVFAGASQLAAIALLGQGAGVLVILVTTFMINLRVAMYSASIAPWLKPFGTATRSLLAYLMTDQAYGFAILKYRREPTLPRREYYLGVAAPLWLLWQTATLLGVGVGTQVPPSWQLEFAIPLTFLAMLAPAVRDRPGLLAALVGGSLSLAFATLPYNLGLVLGALLGITAGTLAERRWPPAAPAADDEETK